MKSHIAKCYTRRKQQACLQQHVCAVPEALICAIRDGDCRGMDASVGNLQVTAPRSTTSNPYPICLLSMSLPSQTAYEHQNGHKDEVTPLFQEEHLL